MSKTNDNTIGGVYCGQTIAPGLYAEKEGEGRFLVRELTDSGSTRRLGLVLGGKAKGSMGRYLALSMSGESLGTADSLRKAAMLLRQHKSAHGGTAVKANPSAPAMSARGA